MANNENNNPPVDNLFALFAPSKDPHFELRNQYLNSPLVRNTIERHPEDRIVFLTQIRSCNLNLLSPMQVRLVKFGLLPRETTSILLTLLQILVQDGPMTRDQAIAKLGCPISEEQFPDEEWLKTTPITDEQRLNVQSLILALTLEQQQDITYDQALAELNLRLEHILSKYRINLMQTENLTFYEVIRTITKVRWEEDESGLTQIGIKSGLLPHETSDSKKIDAVIELATKNVAYYLDPYYELRSYYLNSRITQYCVNQDPRLKLYFETIIREYDPAELQPIQTDFFKFGFLPDETDSVIMTILQILIQYGSMTRDQAIAKLGYVISEEQFPAEEWLKTTPINEVQWRDINRFIVALTMEQQTDITYEQAHEELDI